MSKFLGLSSMEDSTAFYDEAGEEGVVVGKLTSASTPHLYIRSAHCCIQHSNSASYVEYTSLPTLWQN